MENDICASHCNVVIICVLVAQAQCFPLKCNFCLRLGGLLVSCKFTSIWWHESSSICAKRQTPAGAQLRFSGLASYIWPEENTTRLMDFKFQVMGKRAWLSTFWLILGLVRERPLQAPELKRSLWRNAYSLPEVTILAWLHYIAFIVPTEYHIAVWSFCLITFLVFLYFWYD